MVIVIVVVITAYEAILDQLKLLVRDQTNSAAV
jgi:hypothetical protein